MPRPARRSANSAPSRWKRIALYGTPTLLVLAVIGFFIAKAAVYSYLRGDGFRRFVAGKAGVTLRSECELSPLEFTGSNIYTAGFTAHGGTEAPFASLTVDQIRAEISLRRFFEKVWQVESVEVQRVQVALEGSRADVPPLPAAPAGAASRDGSSGGWLPNRVEVGSLTVRDANLAWSGGGLRAATINATPDNGGWKIEGQGGKIEQTGMPALDVQSLQLRYRGTSLFVNGAEFRQGGFGSVKATGEVNFADKLDLQVAIKDVNVTPFLSDDWRVRLKGFLSGDVTVRSPMPLPRGGPEFSGSLSLARGELTALPVLDEIAVFTGTQQFRRLSLTRASADFRQDGSKLRITKFVAESEGLIRIEGDFVIENNMIDGAFLVGVAPTTLMFIPGSREKVFTENRAGYVWAPMRLTGPLNKPKEDLTGRLAKAVGDTAVETVKSAVEDTLKGGKDTIKGALDLLLPGAK